MLFNSIEFIFGFLPITILGFFIIGSQPILVQKQLPLLWLVIASLFFYSWWNPLNLPLIVISIGFNYALGYFLSNHQELSLPRKSLLILGVLVNLALIGYFKYANFAIDNVNYLLKTDFDLGTIALPLAISFFTFQQIAYLVDAYQGATKEYSFLKYILFVSFFPQLIAGPIVHHKDVLPQFKKKSLYRFSSQCLAIGLTVFVAGLFKKVVFADRIAEFANLAFNAASQGIPLTFSEAWTGALAYSLQLYFDFSGYSDMAIGAAYMFGIKLPINFNSPYQSISIIDFWRRWHITLSNFLRDYLYIPLGGNRKGNFRRYLNLLITMLLGGLWHGAGWSFVFWGGLHGVYLIINHQWRAFRNWLGHDLRQDNWLLYGIGWFVTFIAVIVAWVVFRADSLNTAKAIISAMIGINGIALPSFLASKLGFLQSLGITFNGFTQEVGIRQFYSVFGIMLLLAIAWFTPNTQQWMDKYSPTLTPAKVYNEYSWFHKLFKHLHWRPNKVWSAILACLTATSLLCFTRISQFLYFQF
ncbi:MAG: MBOAT family protein [Moorea sp. SIO2B7]|nr:MBOAT family protein [Moorena sp. SIO2B7]